MMFRAQSGDFIDGVWNSGSFDVSLWAGDLDGAKAEADERLAGGEGLGFETGE